MFAGSRTFTALAETGYAPKILAYGQPSHSDTLFRISHSLYIVDKSGRPLWSVVAVLAFGPIGYVNLVAAGDTVCKLCF